MVNKVDLFTWPWDAVTFFYMRQRAPNVSPDKTPRRRRPTGAYPRRKVLLLYNTFQFCLTFAIAQQQRTKAADSAPTHLFSSFLRPMKTPEEPVHHRLFSRPAV